MSPLRIAVALFIASSILGGTHYYLWTRLVRDPQLPAPWAAVGTWTLALLGVLIVAGIALRRAPRALSSPVLWVVYTWLGLMFFLFFLFVTVDAARAVASIVSRLASSPPVDPERRVLLARLVSALVGMGALALGGVGLA